MANSTGNVITNVEQGIEFFKNHAKVEDVVDKTTNAVVGRKISLAKSDHNEFMKQAGVAENMIELVHNANNILYNSAYGVTGNNLEEISGPARKAGVDSKDIKVVTNIYGNKECVSMQLNGVRTGRNPQTNEPTVTYGGGSMKVEIKKHIDKSAVQSLQERMKAILS